MTENVLIAGVITSAIGMGYFLYGKRQQSLVPWVCGLMLLIVPFLISDVAALLAVSALLAATPYFVRV